MQRWPIETFYQDGKEYLGMAFGYWYGETPEYKATTTARAIATVTKAAVVAMLSRTPTPISTFTPMDTPTATRTPTPTATPMPTNTLIPETATAQAIVDKNATATAQAAQARQGTATAQTATAEAKSAQATIERQRTETAQTATSVARTATRIAINATATEVASYKEINYRELVAYADDHVGEKVIVRGVIFNVINKSEFQIWFSGTYESAYISMLDEYTGLYKDTSVVVYGIVAGETCGTNAFGAKVCSPLIGGSFFGK